MTNFFSEEVLDKAPPIVISEVYERVTCGAQYNLELELLDAKKQVIGTWQSQNKGFKNIDCSIDGYQELLSKRITNYGFGVRYIKWIDKIRGKGTGESIRLKKAYLGISPPNLLEVPEKENFWNWKGTNVKGAKKLVKEEVLTSSEEINTFPRGADDKKILTVEGGDWVVRNQKIDLKLNGYLDSDLKNFPAIIFSSSYGRLNCGDEYYLKVVLLDDKNQVLNSFYSGIQKREFNCSSNDNYQELITNFLDTPKGKTVTYIEVEQGLKNIEANSNVEKNAFFSDSYVGLIDINNRQNQRVKRDLAVNANYTSALATVSVGTISCLYLSSITGGIGAPTCAVIGGVAGGLIYIYNYLTDFSVQPIESEKMENNPSDNGSAKTGIDNIAKHLESNGFNLWDISNNDKIEVFATIIEDSKTVKKYYNDYWLPLIRNSSRTFLSIDACLGAMDIDYDVQNFVRLYSDSQYNGKLLALLEGYHKLEGTVLENKVSSLKVPLGWRATLYQEELEFLDEESDGIVTHHKRTAPLTITYDTPFVRKHWNDKTKAIIIEKDPNYSYQVPQLNIPVGLFSEKNFTGNHKFVKDGTYDLKDLVPLGGDQLSSIRVPKGYRVLLYSDPKYQGALKILEEGDYAEIPEQTHGEGDFDNIVSSILVQVLSNSSSSTIVLDDERVFLYQDIFYLGNSQGFYPENEPYTATDLETIGSGQMSSIRVPRGWKATLYYEDLGKSDPGQPVEINFDTPYIGDKWNDKVKSVKIEKLKNYSIPKISKNEKVTLFIDGDFKGAQKELEGDVTYYTSLLLEKFSGRISSIKVPAGWRLIGYTEDLSRGDIILLNSNSSDLTTQTPVLSKSTNFNDKIKSLVAQKIGDYVEDNVSERRSIRGKRSIEKEVIFSTETNMVYGPNPTTGYLNLQCSETFMNKVSKIYIASPGGAEKLISFKNNQKLNIKIDLSLKVAGIHFLIVEKLDGSRVVKKILVP